MTKETISETAALKALLSETADHQILAGMLGFVADRLMALDVDQLCGAGVHERSAGRVNHRNGYRPRRWETRAGTVDVQIPKLRKGTYFPEFPEPRRASEKAMTAVIQEAYIQGVSTRSVDDLVKTMGMTGVSKSQVSRLCVEIDERVDAFLDRPLEGEWPYLWLDATYIKVRRSGRIVSVAAIVAVAVNTDGRREVLGIAIQPSEAEVFWDEFLRALADRGLRGVKLIIADEHKGLKGAAAKVLGATIQRCRVHFMRNALACVGKKDRPIVTAALRTAFDQDTLADSKEHWTKLIEAFQPRHPKLAELMLRAEEDVLAYKTFPQAHWRQIHSTNPLFRLCHSRKSFIVAYPGEPQEMVLDAFGRALSFFDGVPRRVIVDNPKTMVTYVSRSKDRVFHPRFLALMNHYVMEPVACTPASGWEKGQIENQVQHIRQWLFTPKLDFDDLDALNAWLSLRCNELGSRPHPDQKDQTIDAIFTLEQAELRPLGVGFDGYVEKAVRVRSTCLVQYDSNRYSVPAQYAGHHISLRAYAGRIVLVADQKIIAEHKRHFTKNISYFEPWHYVPLLLLKPGALRDGAPFMEWELPTSMNRIRSSYMMVKGGDRDFVELLMLVQEHGIETVGMACDRAVEQNTLRLPAIINLINQLVEPVIEPPLEAHFHPRLQVAPKADCKRYEVLYAARGEVA